jgi:hypothetical protein
VYKRRTLYNIDSAEIVVPIAKFDSQFLPINVNGHKAKVSLPNSELTMIAQLSRQLKLTDSLTRTNSVVVTIKDLYQHKQGSISFQFGDYVEVKFVGRALEDVYKVPEFLVNNNQVWIMNKQNKLERRDIAVVRNENGFAIINNGFKPLDKLVTTVPEYPYQGMPVKVIADSTQAKVKERI